MTAVVTQAAVGAAESEDGCVFPAAAAELQREPARPWHRLCSVLWLSLSPSTSLLLSLFLSPSFSLSLSISPSRAARLSFPPSLSLACPVFRLSLVCMRVLRH